MTERTKQLRATAEGQIEELIALLSTADEGALRRPCPLEQVLASLIKHQSHQIEALKAALT